MRADNTLQLLTDRYTLADVAGVPAAEIISPGGDVVLRPHRPPST